MENPSANSKSMKAAVITQQNCKNKSPDYTPPLPLADAPSSESMADGKLAAAE